MKLLSAQDLRLLCQNLTAYLPPEVSTVAGNNVTDSHMTQPELSVEENDALMYIIVVLGFYSFGVVLMVVSYLKRERKDLEEERLLEDYLRYRPQTLREQRSKIGCKLALSAFNAANLITMPESKESKITFV